MSHAAVPEVPIRREPLSDPTQCAEIYHSFLQDAQRSRSHSPWWRRPQRVTSYMPVMSHVAGTAAGFPSPHPLSSCFTL
jgi:hypothetical protein